MKKLFVFLITVLFIPSVYALELEDVPITNYVNDYSNVLSDETEEYIIDQSKKIDEIDGTQIVVVTYPSLDGMPIEDFVHDLGNYYKIGKDAKGLIIFVATEDRNIRVEVGSNLEGILNDAKVGRFMDTYMIPYLKDDDWDNGIKNGYNAFFNEIVNKNNIDLETTELERFETDDKEDAIAIAMMLSFAVALIGGALGNGIKKLYWGDIVSTGLIGSPIYVSAFKDISLMPVGVVMCIFPFILYILIRLSKGSGYHGGGSGWSSGGGSSWSSGGGFSGGGGGFSGGGASRGF